MNRTTIIAEMAYAHNGSSDLAKRIVSDAELAGADAISIHITSVSDYVSVYYKSGHGRVSAGKENEPFYEYLEKISLTFEEWREVAEFIWSTELDLFIMPNDMRSLRFSMELNPDAYVIPASNFEEKIFIQEIGRYGKPVFLRVGGADIGEMESIIHLLADVGAGPVTLLYGHQNYPTVVEDTNLSFIPYLQKIFGLPVGIADHVDGDDEFSMVAPLLGLPMGITCIEKHLTYDRSEKGEDFEASLNKEEFSEMVRNVRKAETALIDKGLFEFTKSTEIYRQTLKKKVVAARDLKAGEVLSNDMVCLKRSDDGIYPSQLELVFGFPLFASVEKDRGIELDMFRPQIGQ